MKKTIYLALLAILVLVACTQTRDLVTPAKQPDYLSDQELRALPELPRDLSQIQNIVIRDTFPLATDSDYYDKYSKRHFKLDYAPSLFDYVDKVEMLALSVPEEKQKEYPVSAVQFDRGRIFVDRAIKADSQNDGRSGCVAIYKRNGKLINWINPSDDMHERQKSIINRTAKELVVAEDPQLLKCYDYDGNYLRTIYLPKDDPNRYNSRGVWMQQSWIRSEDDSHSLPCIVVFNDSLRPIAKVSNSKFVNNFFNKTGDDDCLVRSLSDTIWQVLPDRCVARYVLTDGKPLPTVNYLWEDSTLDKKIYDNKLVHNATYQTGNSRFLYTVLVRAFLMENGDFGYDTSIAHLYDAKTGHAICYRIDFNNYLLTHKPRLPEWLLANKWLDTPSILPNGTLVFTGNAYGLKKELSHQLEKQEAERDAIITKKDERFVRQLALNDMILFFVKLKKF